ncbi:MAG: VanZ family protein [Vicingaceae bacterium]
MRSAKQRKIGWALVLIWVTLVAYLSFSPRIGLEIPAALDFDKLAHFVMYASLALLLSIPLEPFSKAFNFMLVLAFLFAGATELTQHYLIQNRTGDWYDFAANLAGLGFVTIIFWKRIKT